MVVLTAVGIGIAGSAAAAETQSAAPKRGATPVASTFKTVTPTKTGAVKTAPVNMSQDELLKEVFAIAVKPQTKENIEHVFNLEKEAQALFDAQDQQKALVKFQDVYGLSKEIRYGDGEGRALERMASLYLLKGDKTRAKNLVENAMEVLSESSDKKSLGRARITAAQVYLSLDNPLWSLKELDLAMRDFTASSFNDADEAAKAMILAAQLATRIGQHKEAIRFYKAAATFFGQAGDSEKEVNLRDTASAMLTELGFHTAALEEAKKAVQTARTMKSPEVLAAALIHQATAEYGLCEFMNARQSLEEMLATLNLDKQMIGGQAVAYEAYGHALAATGDLPKAKIILEKSWAILKSGGPAHHRAQTLNALGVVYTLLNQPAKGVEFLRQSLDVQTVVKKESKQGLVTSQNLASALARSGENRQARAELEGTLRSMGKQKQPDQRILGQIYGALGEICLSLKEVAQADAYIRKSIEVSSKVGDDFTLWRDYTNLAHLQIGLQQPATESLSSAASHFRSPQAGNFVTADSNPFPSSREDLACELISLLITTGMPEQALITAEQLKEEAFITEWQRNGGDVKQTDRELYSDMVLERAHLKAAECSTTPDKLLKKWQDWMRRLQLMSHDSLDLARLISPVPLNLAELRQITQEKQMTMLDYLIGSRQSFCFTIDSAGKIAARKLGIGRDALQAQVSSLLAVTQKSGQDSRLTEKQLLQSLLSELMPESIYKQLPPNPEQMIVVVPDGVLFNLPWAALVDAQGRYLIESHTLTSVPALSSFLYQGAQYGADQNLLFSANAENGAEATEISQLFSPEQVFKLTGKNAELAKLQEQVKTNPILHFASPLALADGALLKSKLPLALDDKSVSPSTLFKLNLPTDLSVWSGTSVNAKDKGNGVNVFTRGLAYAGVRNVIMSLWLQPESERVAELVEFYRGKQQGLNQAQSLRKAQLLALSKDPSLRAWAAFQLIGPGR